MSQTAEDVGIAVVKNLSQMKAKRISHRPAGFGYVARFFRYPLHETVDGKHAVMWIAADAVRNRFAERHDALHAGTCKGIAYFDDAMRRINAHGLRRHGGKAGGITQALHRHDIHGFANGMEVHPLVRPDDEALAVVSPEHAIKGFHLAQYVDCLADVGRYERTLTVAIAKVLAKRGCQMFAIAVGVLLIAFYELVAARVARILIERLHVGCTGTCHLLQQFVRGKRFPADQRDRYLGV